MPTCYLPVLFYIILDRLLCAGSDLFACLGYLIDGYGSVLPCIGQENTTLDVVESRIFALENGIDGEERVRIAGKLTLVLELIFHLFLLPLLTLIKDRIKFSFDSDSNTIVCDNSANVSMCNTKSMYVGEMRQIHIMTVATIEGKSHPVSGIVTLKWHWKDDDDIRHEVRVVDVLYFPQSSINILSLTSVARQLKDKDCTGTTTLQTQSRFFGTRTSPVAPSTPLNQICQCIEQWCQRLLIQ